MNEIFLIGKVIDEIEYRFMLQKRIDAKAKIKIETLDKQILEVVSYNEIADYVLQNINNGDIVFINGKIINNEIITEKIEKLH